MKFVATFYSHFGAINFKKIMSQQNIEVTLAPVPRKLSSSCGTCGMYEADSFFMCEELKDELEKIYDMTDENNPKILYKENEGD